MLRPANVYNICFILCTAMQKIGCVMMFCVVVVLCSYGAQVEKERRGQDALLRDMRQLAMNAETNSSGNGSPIGGMAHSFSNANMPGSGAKPSINKNSKR